jgi:membrane-associated phospholipid phosphatase
VRRFWRHLRTLWPGYGIVLPLPFFAHALWAAASGAFRWENGVVTALAAGLFAGGPRTKKLFIGVYPLGLVGLLYSSMKAFENVGVSPETVHLCDLRKAELALFGIDVQGRRITLHDWLQPHATAWLDALCAVPYATFLFVCFGCAIWLYLDDPRRLMRFSWCFFALNVAGFATYHVYPAAPPWYFHAHGCTVDVTATASEGPNLARVDHWLGVHYFAGMYGRASDVFGAMPSLHVSYALLVALEGWPTFRWGWRVLAVLFFILMAFAAVYLDHHWMLDVVAGSALCVVVVALARASTGRFPQAAGRATALDPAAFGPPQEPAFDAPQSRAPTGVS